MKEKDLYVDDKTRELILYAEKDDETYAEVKSGSYAVKHYIDEFYRIRQNLENELNEKLEKGLISPVYYFMLMQDMGLRDLAGRVGISRRKLKKHFEPRHFLKLDDWMLERYAQVFGVTAGQLKEMMTKQ